MSDRCEAHKLTRCVVCAALERKGVTPGAPPPPSAITGAPPENLEGLSVRDRLPTTQEEFNTEYDAIIADIATPSQDTKYRPGQIVDYTDKEDRLNKLLMVKPAAADITTRPTFKTLPTDDSHASKVERAAAELVSSTQTWAQEIAYVERIKSILLGAEATLSRAVEAKNKAENDLKSLMGGTE